MPDLIPVFVFPSSIQFFTGDQATHKQVLTIHNPYDFPVKFKVLCSSHERNKYSVVDPEGTINPNCCVDIVIRHNAVNLQNIGQNDKFRIQLCQIPSNQVVGKKDVLAELISGSPDRLPSTESEFGRPMASNTAANAQLSMQQKTAVRPAVLNTGIVSVLAFLCGVILLLPIQGEHSSFISDLLKPTVNQKLVASYVLGLLTMLILRTA